ncbi:ArnT family glycosyltransferase [Dictyobacter arantiisoli]|nr:hypothetical protein [Dictyobacter arantiisoli]
MDSYTLGAAAIILFAVALRILLVVMHWPPTNSDEATMAAMAQNIAYHGERPIMYYGQDYMGVLEAYLGAFFYLLSGGPSITAIRMGVILLVGCFFIALYFFTNLIFSKKLALVTLALLSIGSIPYLTRQTIATGGSTETLLFGTLAFLLAARLSITYDVQTPSSRQIIWRRLLGYLCFGIVVGLGLWSDMVCAPLLGMATLLLIFFCWRDILRWGGWVIFLLGGSIGLIPTILYSLQPHPANPNASNPLYVLFAMFLAKPGTPDQTGLWHHIVETFQVSIPTATSFPFCPVIEYPFLGDNTPRTLQCGIMQSSWSIGYVALIIITAVIAIIALRHFRLQGKALNHTERHQYQVRQVTRLTMALTAVGIIAAFTISSGPFDQPGYHARYIISLIPLTPAIIAPLWEAASRIQWQALWPRVRTYASRVILAAIAIIFLTGTCIAFSEMPQAQAADNQRLDVANHLIKLGATPLYTDYWTCASLAFVSKEKVLCTVTDVEMVKGKLTLGINHNRVARYNYPLSTYMNLRLNASWMCEKDPKTTVKQYNCLPLVEKWLNSPQSKGRFTRYEFDGYVLYMLKPQFRKPVPTIPYQYP